MSTAKAKTRRCIAVVLPIGAAAPLALAASELSYSPKYNTMMANIANGSLPTNINVTTSGSEVVFSAWPYRTVLWSVWEFLEQQGIRSERERILVN